MKLNLESRLWCWQLLALACIVLTASGQNGGSCHFPWTFPDRLSEEPLGPPGPTPSGPGICSRTLYRRATRTAGYIYYREGYSPPVLCRNPQTGRREELCIRRPVRVCDVGYRISFYNELYTDYYCCPGYTGTVPDCTRIQCPWKSLGISNGRVSVDNYNIGGIATYSCDYGYVMEGVEERVCQSSGSWSGSAPYCQAIICPTLSHPTNGDVLVDSHLVGEYGTATYSCHSGFGMIGSSTRRCTVDPRNVTNGVWSGSQPSCHIVCPVPSTPTNGRVDHPALIIVGSIAVYSCDEGYGRVGPSVRTCLPSRSWTLEDPTCLRQCPRLVDIENGAVSIDSRFVDNVATYTCDDGYELVGESSPICRQTGEWSSSPPSCDPACPTLHNPSHGSVTVTTHTVGGIASYMCGTGYGLDGLSSRTCESDAMWSGTEPTCIIVCSAPSSPTNGHVDFPSLITVGSIAEYTCNTGYGLSGPSERICLSSRDWSLADDPTCRRQCPLLVDIENGAVSIDSRFVDSVAYYTCGDGYELVGESSTICQQTGEWSSSPPSCDRVCPALHNPSHGSVTITTRAVGGIATYTCGTGYGLDGLSSLTCGSSGVWSGTEPTCRRVCPVPSTPTNGRVDVPALITVGSIAVYSCDESYGRVGPSVRTCLPSREWTLEDPTCLRKCPLLVDIENGAVSIDSRFVDSVANYSCDDGYELVGESSTICRQTGEWSSSPPSCDHVVQCPIPDDLRNGQVIYTSRSVGSKVKYTCDSGFNLFGLKSRKCKANGKWRGLQPSCVPDTTTTTTATTAEGIDATTNQGVECNCRNGGTCVIRKGKNKCECPPGFWGRRCHKTVE